MLRGGVSLTPVEDFEPLPACLVFETGQWWERCAIPYNLVHDDDFGHSTEPARECLGCMWFAGRPRESR